MQNRQAYPANWEELARQCKELAGWRCQHCQIEHGAWRVSRKGQPYQVWMTAAHKWPFDQSNPNPDLLCLCFSCHARYDAPWLLRAQWVELERLKHRVLLKLFGAMRGQEVHDGR